LLINPLMLNQTGFRFSFLIVTVLILGWRVVARGIEQLTEQRLWTPLSRRSHLLERGRRKMYELVGCSILAWAGSVGLMAWSNGLIVPASFVVNLCLSVLAYATILTGFIEVIMSFLPFSFPAVVVGKLAGFLLFTIRALVSAGSTPPGSLGVCRGLGCLAGPLSRNGACSPPSDAVVVGKGMTAGFHGQAATIFRKKFDNLAQFDALSTNGNAPLAALAALACNDEIEKNRDHLSKMQDVSAMFPKDQRH